MAFYVAVSTDNKGIADTESEPLISKPIEIPDMNNMHDSAIEEESKNYVNNFQPNLFCCSLCIAAEVSPYTCSTASTLYRHVAISHCSKVLACNYCFKKGLCLKFSSEVEFKYHVNQYHTKNSLNSDTANTIPEGEIKTDRVIKKNKLSLGHKRNSVTSNKKIDVKCNQNLQIHAQNIITASSDLKLPPKMCFNIISLWIVL